MSHALVLAAVAATVLSGVVPAQGGDPSGPGSYEVLGTVVRFERAEGVDRADVVWSAKASLVAARVGGELRVWDARTGRARW